MKFDVAFKTLAVGLVWAACSVLPSWGARADEIRIIAANAVKDGYQELAAAFERETGHRVTTVWSGTEATARRIAAGESFDLALIGSDAIDRLVAQGAVSAGSRRDFAKSGVAIAARAGYATAPIRTVEDVKAAVLAAPRIAYSAGPSGIYIASLMRRLDIADQAAAKLTQPSSGAEVAQLLSQGRIDLAFAQVSEFMGVQGVVELGPLPAAIQNFTIYAFGRPIAANSAAGGAAAVFMAFVTSPRAAEAIRRMGMDPI